MSEPARIQLPDDGPTVLVDRDIAPTLEGRARLGSNGYIYVGRATTLHAEVMGGSRPGMHIDHINGDKLDNRRANLRYVTYQANQINRKRLNRNNTSGVRGVRWEARRGKWLAQIMANRKTYFLGHFDVFEDAIAARKAGEARLWS